MQSTNIEVRRTRRLKWRFEDDTVIMMVWNSEWSSFNHLPCVVWLVEHVRKSIINLFEIFTSLHATWIGSLKECIVKKFRKRLCGEIIYKFVEKKQ